ncbi:MAG: ribosome small subunit-dependent GTPase A [Candidatus Obscuribacterales bacterium]|nr:ribosome small subunit-dependent GTPase A [Candidatus Obscuribacterales bacterium]
MISQFYVALVEPPSICARVIAQNRDAYTVQTEEKEFFAELSGAFRFHAFDPQDLPAVGDYVRLRRDPDDIAVIEELLPRMNLFARREVYGGHLLQPIAANLSTLFITIAVNRDFNVRRIERYLVAATAFGVPAAVILTKIDLVDDVSPFIHEVKEVAEGLPVLAVSSAEHAGLEALAPFRGPDCTIAFVGSSGVGKSTLINALLGSSVLTVNEIRAGDDRGRHTTTSRMLLYLNDGTAIIDTPGMREFALADASTGINLAFADVATIADACRFRDCRHRDEPGCAVTEALDEERLQSFRKLEREAAFEARKTDPRKAAEERKKWKTIHRANRQRERF